MGGSRADCGRRNTVRLCRLGSLRVEDAGLVPALAALKRLARRLKRIDGCEVTRIGLLGKKPTTSRFKADELVAVLRYVWPPAASAYVELG